MNNDLKTEQLRKYINNPEVSGVCNIDEDDTFIYFETEDIKYPMELRAMDYEVCYQEAKDYYRVRVLKPNWFSHGLEQQMKEEDNSNAK
jgi:hypothetical protein